MNQIMRLFVAIIFAWLGDTANAFTCTAKGVFANTDSNDCTSYVYCDSNNNPSVQYCQSNTYFWPQGKGCFSQYNCAAQTMPGNKDPCAGYYNNDIPDKSSTDCTQYLSCRFSNIWSGGDYVQVPQVNSQPCSSGTAFKPGYGCISTSSYQCVNYDCTSEGYFENPNDCSTFIQCFAYSGYDYQNNVMFKLFYPGISTCPADTKFNPTFNKCDSFYQCNGVDPHGGVDPCSEYNYASPIVANRFDASASSYILCQSSSGNSGTIDVIAEQQCPAFTFFSPLLGKCYSSYDPDEGCSKDPCSSGPGRYTDFKSGHCDTFIECRDLTTTREVYEPVYSISYCPPRTQFSPLSKKCERQYVCPTFPVNYCYPQIPTTTTTTTTTSPPMAG